MKKKMVILGTLLMAVVATSYSVSGTYAKYVSEVSIADEARVAKWEIGLTADSKKDVKLFKESYDVSTATGVVKSLGSIKDISKVVAPGTSGKYTFALSSNIETNYKITVTATGDNNVVLKEDETDANKVTYNPIKFYLSHSSALDIPDTSAWYDFDTLKAELNKLYSKEDGSKIVYAPGQTPEGSYTIHWAWDFETGHDAEDTKLGENMVKAENDSTLAAPTIDLTIKIKAEQTQEAATVAPTA